MLPMLTDAVDTDAAAVVGDVGVVTAVVVADGNVVVPVDDEVGVDVNVDFAAAVIATFVTVVGDNVAYVVAVASSSASASAGLWC